MRFVPAFADTLRGLEEKPRWLPELLDFKWAHILDSDGGSDGGTLHDNFLPWLEEPARPYTLQAYESDFGFVQRLLARAGLLYWFGSVNGREVMCVSDSNFQGEFLGPVTFHEPDGQSNRKGVVDDLRIRATMHTTSYRDHGPRPWTELAEETMAAKRLEDERIACERWRLHGGGDHAGLAAGSAIDLDGRRPGLSDVSGIYLIVVAHHRMEEAAENKPARYRCNFELIYRKTPFRPPVPMKPELPELFSARVESDGKLPCLDGEGRYRVALHADENRHRVAEGSPLLRKVEPYGGPRPRSGAAPGWRFALQPGDEVLLTCLASDPEQPYLIGYAPSAAQLGPVTGANPTENMLRTPMGNLILFDDRKGQERIVLNALDGRIAMTFSAEAEASFIQVAAHAGRAALQAKKNLRLKSGENLTERVGAERTQTVAQNSRTVTTEGDIHHQAAINAAISAGRYALLHANGKLQTVAAKRLRLHTRKGAHFTLFGPKGLVAKFHNGKVAVQSGGAIRIKGRGNAPITFAQNGGGFTISPKGDIKLFGKRVTLKSAGEVKFNGPVDYTVPGGNEPESPSVPDSIEREVIDPLRPPEAPELILRDSAWRGNEQLDGIAEGSDDTLYREGTPGPDEQVKKLQANLKRLGIRGVGVADGLFGPKTTQAVKLFQAHYALREEEEKEQHEFDRPLSADGIVGRSTLLAMDEALVNSWTLPPLLHESWGDNDTLYSIASGSAPKLYRYDPNAPLEHDPGVELIQANLHQLGITSVGSADGLFGPGTAGAVQTFQEQYALREQDVEIHDFTRPLGADGIVGRQTLLAMDEGLVNGWLHATPVFTNPSGGPVRNDAGGAGHWHASRGSRLHLGIDLETENGQNIVAPFDGEAMNFRGARRGQPIVHIYPSDQNTGIVFVRILYVNAPNGVEDWKRYPVKAGDVIGTAADLHGPPMNYPERVGPHIHLEVHIDHENNVSSRVDPLPYLFPAGLGRE